MVEVNHRRKGWLLEHKWSLLPVLQELNHADSVGLCLEPRHMKSKVAVVCSLVPSLPWLCPNSLSASLKVFVLWRLSFLRDSPSQLTGWLFQLANPVEGEGEGMDLVVGVYAVPWNFRSAAAKRCDFWNIKFRFAISPFENAQLECPRL